MEAERNSIVKTPSLTKQARTFNAIANDNTIQGMKTAAVMDRNIREAEKAQKEARNNPVIEETRVPTGAEIREAREEGEYR